MSLIERLSKDKEAIEATLLAKVIPICVSTLLFPAKENCEI